jgi:hypothetical protein
MPDTVAGLFRNRVEAEEALRKLEEAGFSRDQLSLSTPRVARRGHYGLKVLIGIGAGILIGAVLGAVVSGAAPGMHALLPGNKLALFLFIAFAGAITGGVAGALVAIAASGDTTLYYEQEVQAGRFLVVVSGPELARARALMLAAGAMEAAPVEAPLHEGRPRAEGGG